MNDGEDGVGKNGIEAEIRRWIQQATDPKDKAMLMIMYEIHGSLQENTKATEAIAERFSSHKEQFDLHIKEERDLFAQGKGLYRAMSVSLVLVTALASAVMGLGGYILKHHVDMNDQQEVAIRGLQDQNVRNEEWKHRVDEKLKVLDLHIIGGNGR